MTDWLPQPFALLSAPAFLAVYAAFAVAVIVFSRLQINAADRSLAVPLPPVSPERDPYEVAYLRGGGNELLRFAIFDGVRRGLLRVVPPAKAKRAVERIEADPGASPPADASPLLEQIVAFYGSSRTTEELFASPLPKAAEAYGAAAFGAALEAERFFPGSEVHAAATRVRLYGALALVIFAGLRIAHALSLHHRNVGFLILETLAALVILLVATRVRRLSRRGRGFLERLRAALRPAGLRPVAAGFAALPIFVAATGMSALAGTEFAPMNKLFRRQASSSGCDGGSNSCGSGSSGGGGSSCGGGGGCGGGCGG